MDLDSFDFSLPPDLIALRPLRPRPASRLLVAEGARTAHATVSALGDWLRPGDCLVFNDTRVIPARLFGERRRDSPHGSGIARVEVTLIRRDGADVWAALARPAKRLAPGDRVHFDDLGAEVVSRDAATVTLRFDRAGPDLDAAIAQVGQMPLPPYIAQRRPADAQDREDYQTVLAARDGAVAAPTAALHFDRPLLDSLTSRGVLTETLTLHVGAGTFLPVTAQQIAEHRIHAEWGELTASACAQITAARAAGGRVIAVGTTALRLLESAAAGGTLAPFSGDTEIFISPGYSFRAVDGLMTNFHLPRSTLFMLVCALMGTARMHALYADAIAEGYRFYSYGDSSLLLPENRR
jgi:S-adenosylmethionine:tRNA ribosyltransferase-isomerase